jgi:Importin-beta N-terminal domain
MADLSALFLASLNPQTRKEAENTLEQLSLQPNFSLSLLSLTLDGSGDRAVRLASGVYLKNTVRKRWDPVSHPFPSWPWSRSYRAEYPDPNYRSASTRGDIHIRITLLIGICLS